MVYLITGATGFIGQQIVARCKEQHITVHYLTTSKAKIENTETYKGFYWDPKTDEIDVNAFEGVSTIIHLAGANVAKRWTKSYKKEILDSRIKSALLIKNTLETLDHSVTHFISASGIGIYENSLIEIHKEDSTLFGNDFLAEVTKKWEAATDSFLSLNISTSKIRIGIVFAKKEGALPKMTHPIKMYLGAAFGKGNQWQSWIHVKDLTSIFMYVAQHKLTGTYNAVAPNVVTQNKLIDSCGKVLSKPIWLPNIPKFMVKIILGEMGSILLSSQQVSAVKIQDKGFIFEFPSLRKTLQFLLH